MLNRNPSNTSNVLNSYRKRRQQKGPFLVYGAVALVIIGGIMLIVWLTSPGQPLSGLFPSETPTPTLTLTTTNTSAPTDTATITLTPTITVSPTPSEPFDYTIQEGDTLFAIAERFNLGEDGILLIYHQNPQILEQFGGSIQVGQTIKIPLPGTILPTRTPVPANLPRGTKIEYTVLAGDTIGGIAARFNSLADNIIADNNIENPNALQVGQVLQIPVNLVTATPTFPPTSTPVTPTTAGGQPTATAATANATSEPACSFEENTAFFTQLQALINEARTGEGLSALSVNSQLAAAAKAHAVDMLCTNLLKHEGSDGSSPESRVSAQGFTASLVIEDLYASRGSSPQDALDWWLANSDSRADILSEDTTAFGVAYVSSDESMLGSYFVVVSAKP